jgi:hypothetical protein
VEHRENVSQNIENGDTLIRQFLVASIKNPDLKFGRYATEHKTDPLLFHSHFNEYRSITELQVLWALYTQQIDDFRSLKNGVITLKLFEKRRTSTLLLLRAELAHGLSSGI